MAEETKSGPALAQEQHDRKIGALAARERRNQLIHNLTNQIHRVQGLATKAYSDARQAQRTADELEKQAMKLTELYQALLDDEAPAVEYRCCFPRLYPPGTDPLDMNGVYVRARSETEAREKAKARIPEGGEPHVQLWKPAR